MKYLIIFLLLIACKKSTTTVTPVAPVITPMPALHAFELKWITSSTSYKRVYTYPSNQNQNYLINKADSSASNSIVKYDYYEGVPNKYNHTINGYCAVNTDSIECQLWIDGVMVIKKKDQNFVHLNYNY